MASRILLHYITLICGGIAFLSLFKYMCMKTTIIAIGLSIPLLFFVIIHHITVLGKYMDKERLFIEKTLSDREKLFIRAANILLSFHTKASIALFKTLLFLAAKGKNTSLIDLFTSPGNNNVHTILRNTL